MNSRILAIVCRDLVVAEGHCHKFCYRYYTKDVDTVEASDARDEKEGNDESRYEAAVMQSYNQLFLFIRNELFAKPQVMIMADLFSRLVASMKSFGTDHVRDSTKKYIQQKLESEFDGSLHTFPSA
ncbi:hypothetical protein Hamer_G025577 [Homarus americanus]|uniref:Uncharacterized protein n=1 Tax=Homarus americanus TaxID=6706 RepID=A0A8J5KF28_HOMAM|nr:hypothetical protein Hamer_G025577 [Homarus americanus]